MWAWRKHVNRDYYSKPKRTTQRLREVIGAEALEPVNHARIVEK